MKVTAASKKIKVNTCPDCGSSAMVMGMKTGNAHLKGCIKCRNCQGPYLSAKEASAAWKEYVTNRSTNERTTARDD